MKRSDIYDLHIWVFQAEDSAQLGIFSLQELCHRYTLQFFNWNGADVHLHSSPIFDGRPFLLEFVHHLFPDEQAFVGQFFNSIFCLFLEQVQSESPLNYCCFLHQEAQMLVGLSCFVHSEILLDHGCCKDWAFWSFEHSGWNLHKLSNLILVVDTVKHFFFGWLVQIFSGQLNKLPTIHISQLDIMIGKQLLKIHQYEGHWAPLVYVCSPERNELGCLVNEFSFSEHELMQGVLVHQLVVSSGFDPSFSLDVDEVCLLWALVSSWCKQCQLHCWCFGLAVTERRQVCGYCSWRWRSIERNQSHWGWLELHDRTLVYSPLWGL